MIGLVLCEDSSSCFPKWGTEGKRGQEEVVQLDISVFQGEMMVFCTRIWGGSNNQGRTVGLWMDLKGRAKNICSYVGYKVSSQCEQLLESTC